MRMPKLGPQQTEAGPHVTFMLAVAVVAISVAERCSICSRNKK
jgi:hypothetical protein